MKRRNITIRDDQAEWVENADADLSTFVQQSIDEAMAPSETELEAAYRENAEHAANVTEKWATVSLESNEHLGPSLGTE